MTPQQVSKQTHKGVPAGLGKKWSPQSETGENDTAPHISTSEALHYTCLLESQSIKAKETQEMLRSHVLILQQNKTEAQVGKKLAHEDAPVPLSSWWSHPRTDALLQTGECLKIRHDFTKYLILPRMSGKKMKSNSANFLLC